MFGPSFQYASEGEEVHEAGVHVHEGEGLIAVVIEVVDFFGDEQLDQLTLVFVVALGVKVEEVGGGVVRLFEDFEGLDGGEVGVQNGLHALVEEAVVACHELLD